MSSNGQKLHNLIIKYNLNVVNSMEICSGTFTRANNKIVGEKSVLDYVIVSDELIRYADRHCETVYALAHPQKWQTIF